MLKKKLIVNADDFGQSSGINHGIIQAHEEGIVSSASLMVRYKEAPAAAAAAAAAYARRNHRLGVGLHVDLGEWVYRESTWMPLYEVVDLNDVTAVKLEVNKQLDTFIQLMGMPPTHIDSHQHVHLKQPVSKIFVEIARKLNIPLRRNTSMVQYCGDFYGQTAEGKPFHEAISTNSLRGIIKRLQEGFTEMACHPALGIDIVTMYRIEREIEVKTLCDIQIKELIESEGAELCSFRDVG